MRFLSKTSESVILAEALVYRVTGDNRRLRSLLLDEQCGFCAYSEKRVNRLDSVEVEHFDRSKKGRDDYYNYYAVIREANLRKKGKEQKHTGASFFSSLFFHNPVALGRRIRYVIGDGVYETTSADDDEAAALIDFPGFNDNCLCEERSRHIRRLRDLFGDARYSASEKHSWFDEHPEDLSFATAIEAEIGLDLSLVLH